MAIARLDSFDQRDTQWFSSNPIATGTTEGTMLTDASLEAGIRALQDNDIMDRNQSYQEYLQKLQGLQDQHSMGGYLTHYITLETLKRNYANH